MQTSSSNKQSQETRARKEFILSSHKRGFSPNEILVLLKREGFRSVARSRIYQILDEAKGKK
jgi:IS30 family transposase